jgi:F-type H+-transporting ATPase subunit alpha
VNRFEAAFLNEVRARHADVLDAIRKEREISKATEDKLNSVLTAFVKSFA